MGTITKAQCTKCSYEKEFYEGGGLADCKLITILTALGEENGKILAAEINRGAKSISITRKLCTCASCSTMQTTPIVTYAINGETKTLSAPCSQCGKNGEQFRLPPENGRCPQCGAAVKLQHAGHWD